MKRIFRQVSRSAGFYPITCLYVVACVMIALVVGTVVPFAAGLLVLGLGIVIALLSATVRELRAVQALVAAQQVELARINNHFYARGDNHDAARSGFSG